MVLESVRIRTNRFYSCPAVEHAEPRSGEQHWRSEPFFGFHVRSSGLEEPGKGSESTLQSHPVGRGCKLEVNFSPLGSTWGGHEDGTFGTGHLSRYKVRGDHP